MKYALFTLSQDQEHVMQGLINSFKYLGGIPLLSCLIILGLSQMDVIKRSSNGIKDSQNSPLTMDLFQRPPAHTEPKQKEKWKGLFSTL